MTPFDAALLGMIHGATEFLPVSSDGHSTLVRLLFDIPNDPVIALMLELGPLLAVFVLLRRNVGGALVEGSRALVKPYRFRRIPSARDALVVAVATLPSVAIAFAFRHVAGGWHASPWVIGLGFLATGAILVSTRWVRRGRDESPSLLGAVVLGVAHGLGVLPGLSQTGATVSVALWLGLRPDRAYELSMLTALPVGLLAVTVGVRGVTIESADTASALLAGVCAAAFAAVGLVVLRRVTVRGRLFVFALWVFPVAIATLALARAWPTS